MVIAGKIAMLSTLRVMLGEHYFAGASTTSTALAFPLRVSPSAPAPLIHFRASPSVPAPLVHFRPRSTASSSSAAVARAAGGNPYFGGAGGTSKGSGGADAEDSSAYGTGLGRADEPLGVNEARRVARVVAMFLLIQKVFFLQEKKMSEIKWKILMVILIGLGVWIGFMAVKGEQWAVNMAGAFDKGEKIYKIVSAVATVFK